MQLSKMLEESESKKVQDAELQELHDSSQELESQVEVLQQQLSASQAYSDSLQQDLHASRYALDLPSNFMSGLWSQILTVPLGSGICLDVPYELWGFLCAPALPLAFSVCLWVLPVYGVVVQPLPACMKGDFSVAS